MTAIKQSLNRHLSLKLNDFRLLHCSKMLQLTGCINWPMLMVFIVQNKVCHLIILSQYFAYLLAIFLLLAKQHMPMMLEACRTSLSVWHVHCDYLAVGRNRQFSAMTLPAIDPAAAAMWNVCPDVVALLAATVTIELVDTARHRSDHHPNTYISIRKYSSGCIQVRHGQRNDVKH